MNVSGIEYFRNIDGTPGYSWNPFTGCVQPAEVCACHAKCWARITANRFGKTPEEKAFHPVFHPERLHEPGHVRKPARIGVSFMGDLFSVKPGVAHLDAILTEVWNCPQHTFVFLTKSPQKLVSIKWPANCWVGTTVTKQSEFDAAYAILPHVEGLSHRPKRFISFEPLMGSIEMFDYYQMAWLDWVIIGGWQGGRQPDEWQVRDLIEECDNASPRISVWLKNNLKAVPPNGYRDGVKRQELPI